MEVLLALGVILVTANPVPDAVAGGFAKSDIAAGGNPMPVGVAACFQLVACRNAVDAAGHVPHPLFVRNKYAKRLRTSEYYSGQ